MTKIIVALDSSLAARSVLASARALASLLDAEVEALHVQTDGERTVRATADAAAVRLRTVKGSAARCAPPPPDPPPPATLSAAPPQPSPLPCRSRS